MHGSSDTKTKRILSGLKDVCSKILILLETTIGILFSLEGFQKCLLQLKLYSGWFTFHWRDSDVLPGGFIIPLEGFRYLSYEFIISLEGYWYPYRGFTIPLEGFRYLSRGFIIPLEGYRYLYRGFIIPLEGFRYLSRGFLVPLKGLRTLSRGFIIPL